MVRGRGWTCEMYLTICPSQGERKLMFATRAYVSVCLLVRDLARAGVCVSVCLLVRDFARAGVRECVFTRA